MAMRLLRDWLVESKKKKFRKLYVKFSQNFLHFPQLLFSKCTENYLTIFRNFTQNLDKFNFFGGVAEAIPWYDTQALRPIVLFLWFKFVGG